MASSTRRGGGKRWLRIAAIMVAVAAGVEFKPFPFPAAAQESKPLVLAVHPYLPALEIERRFAPLARHLEAATGRRFQISVSSDYSAHIKRVGTHSVDIAYLGPAPYVTLVKTYGREFPLLARQETNGTPAFHGHIVVAETSDLETLADVRGRSFAFGDPQSTMSHLVPYYMLLEAGVKLDDLTRHPFLGGHRNVALGVLSGDFAAGAVKEDIYEEYRARGLRSIAVSPPIPDHPFVATRVLPADLRDKIRASLLALGADPAKRGILTSIQPDLTRFISAEDSDYDILRRVIERLGRENTR